MRNRIDAINDRKDTLSFFLSNEKGRFYLCSAKYHEAVKQYFGSGRSESEIRNFNYKSRCAKNMHIRKIIERLPKTIDYVMKYEVEQ